MDNVIKGLFGKATGSAAAAASRADDEFADFATRVTNAATQAATTVLSEAATATARARRKGQPGFFEGFEGRPYTAWYRVWERTSWDDFRFEIYVVPVIFVLVLLQLWGIAANKKKAQAWAQAHVPALGDEFALVGFEGRKGKGFDALKQKGKHVYQTYATGRQNIASCFVRLTLFKRYNPMAWAGETVLSFFVESMSAPAEKLEAIIECFDGKEKDLAPRLDGSVGNNSSYDGFVWAIVHKDHMKRLRKERYDLSLTTTRDSPKLPDWATIMAESSEISDALLTPEIIKAVTAVGEDFEALIITDQGIDAPAKLDDTVPKKRIFLTTTISTTPASQALFATFLSLPDFLVSKAHFRPEALRKVKQTREEESRKLRKIDEELKAEERRTASDKAKKEERDRKLAGMSADEQRKFLEKEKELERKRSQKKQVQRA